MPENVCKEKILSEEYQDIIFEYSSTTDEVMQIYEDYCVQIAGFGYATLYVKNESTANEWYNGEYPYTAIPKLYGLMNTAPIESTGALRIQNQTGLMLDGSGVIIGFVDTGIDYRQNSFRKSNGLTRILSIWDQSDQSGNTPLYFDYGSEWSSNDINRAIRGELEIGLDTVGHGTFLAGAACGKIDEENNFASPAPNAEIVMVKLKPAKQYLRDYYRIDEDAVAYQENDIMNGVRYLQAVASREGKPLVIVIGIQSNQGGHNGDGTLEQILSNISNIVGNTAIAGSGNEGDKRHHFKSKISVSESDFLQESQEYVDVEIHVGNNSKGFVAELWGKAPDVFSVSFISPNGELVPEIPVRTGVSDKLDFVFSDTQIYIDYRLIEKQSGDELIYMRFLNPLPGVWTIRVYGTNVIFGEFDIWLPIENFSKNVFFLKPDPDTTLTNPSSGRLLITTTAYNSFNDTLFIDSGRGYTRTGAIKPDVATPGVNITVPRIGPVSADSLPFDGNFGYTTTSGSSMASAILGGICAQFMQWGIVMENQTYMRAVDIKTYLIRGADRNRNISYPDKSWGYGLVDVYEAFARLRG